MRIKRFDITSDVFKMLFGGQRIDFEVERNPIPADAELVRVHTNLNESTPALVSLFYTSATFPDLPEGSIPKPTLIWLRQYHKEAAG
jgi:hypothetical protein